MSTRFSSFSVGGPYNVGGGFTAPSVRAPTNTLGKSHTNLLIGSHAAVQVIGAVGSFLSAKHAAKMQDDANRHADVMAGIERSLMQSLSGQQLDDAERQYGEQSMQVMIARMVAESSAVNEGAGIGNESGTSRVRRQAHATELNAKNALQHDLRSERINLAQGRFNSTSRFIQRTTHAPISKPSFMSSALAAGTSMIRIGQQAIADRSK
jgi:hypothetical protein